MRANVDKFFAHDVPAFTRKLTELERIIPPTATAEKDAHYHQLADAIRDSQNICRHLEAVICVDMDLLKDTQHRFQENTSPWFDQSWIAHRSRTKPRGYPGDFELLDAVYDNRPKSTGLGGYIDLYLLNLPIGESVRARWKAMRSFLIDEVMQRRGDIFILNVGCGSCREYVGGMKQSGDRKIHVTCIDHDQQALDFVEEKVAKSATGISDLRCTRYNALRMRSAKATVRRFGRSDVIYSMGLCDYVPDEYLIAMLTGWRESLNDRGVLNVTFKDCNRYDKTPYQWLVDWHFLQRTEGDCRQLFERAGFDLATLQMTRDVTGVIMSFVSRVKAPALVRVDAPADRAKPVAGKPVTRAGRKDGTNRDPNRFKQLKKTP